MDNDVSQYGGSVTAYSEMCPTPMPTSMSSRLPTDYPTQINYTISDEFFKFQQVIRDSDSEATSMNELQLLPISESTMNGIDAIYGGAVMGLCHRVRSENSDYYGNGIREPTTVRWWCYMIIFRILVWWKYQW